MNEETVKQIALVAWQGAANAHRMYPDNNHTFVNYWEAAKNQFEEFITAQPSQESDRDKEEVKKDEIWNDLGNNLREAKTEEPEW